MRGYFDEEPEERKPHAARRDAELTLGAGTLLGIFFALVLLCGLCFGLGYEVGRGGVPSQITLPAGTPAKPETPANGAAKPQAAQQAAAEPATDPGQTATSETATAQAPHDMAAPAPARAEPSRPAVVPVPQPGKPAQQPQSKQPQIKIVQAAPPPAKAPARPAAMPPLQSYPQQKQTNAAYTPGGSSYGSAGSAQLMVQIAAVSNPEDGDVLVSALRKRGYSVSARHEADNLIHVRIGPFASRDEANRWRQKLLNDGYNAQVQ